MIQTTVVVDTLRAHSVTVDTLRAKVIIVGNEVQKNHPVAPDWFPIALMILFFITILGLCWPRKHKRKSWAPPETPI